MDQNIIMTDTKTDNISIIKMIIDREFIIPIGITHKEYWIHNKTTNAFKSTNFLFINIL